MFLCHLGASAPLQYILSQINLVFELKWLLSSPTSIIDVSFSIFCFNLAFVDHLTSLPNLSFICLHLTTQSFLCKSFQQLQRSCYLGHKSMSNRESEFKSQTSSQLPRILSFCWDLSFPCKCQINKSIWGWVHEGQEGVCWEWHQLRQ